MEGATAYELLVENHLDASAVAVGGNHGTPDAERYTLRQGVHNPERRRVARGAAEGGGEFHS